MSVYRTKGERISMKKFKIKTNLVSGVIMGVAALLLIILLPSQVRVPAYDSGAPSPRIIPGICLAIMLVSSSPSSFRALSSSRKRSWNSTGRKRSLPSC